MKRDLVLTEQRGEVVRIDPATLSEQARAFLPSVLGGAMDLEHGRVAVALGGNSRALDVPDAIAEELGGAVGRAGTFMRIGLEPRPLPEKPERRDFGDEVQYFRAAARHADIVDDIFQGE